MVLVSGSNSDAGARRRRRWAWVIPAIAVGLVPAAVAPPGSGATTQTRPLSGVVFVDHDYDGTRDLESSVSAAEPGLAGVSVRAVAVDGRVSATAVTNSSGVFSLLAESGDVRVEYFAIPGGYEPGPTGPGAGPAVQFVAGGPDPVGGLDLGVVRPADFCRSDAAVVVSCFVLGGQTAGPHTGKPTIRSLTMNGGLTNTALPPDDHGGFFPSAAAAQPGQGRGLATQVPPAVRLATAADVGTVWGLAPDPGNDAIYAGAFTRRHAGWGPAGAGGIYRIGADGAQVLVDLASPAMFGPSFTAPLPPRPAAGAAAGRAGSARPTEWLGDDRAIEAVGRTAFGDLEMGPDGRLYAVALGPRQLVQISVGPGAVSRDQVRLIDIPAPCRFLDDGRPFALAAYDGDLLVGGVCSAETTNSPVDLTAWIQVFDTATGRFEPEVLITIPLGSLTHGARSSQWRPWTAGVSVGAPMLTGITVDGADLVIAIRDRSGDQRNGFDARSDLVTSDLLRLCATPAGFTLEDNARCPGGAPTRGAGNGEGPGGGEFYIENLYRAPNNLAPAGNSEMVQGAVAIAPGSLLAATIVDPTEPNETGIAWFSPTSGLKRRAYTLDSTVPRAQTHTPWGKSNSLGDLEVVCGEAPLWVGDRVWLDDDGDGVQDPGEPGIAGVQVDLYEGDTRRGSLVTGSRGEWQFGGVGNAGLDAGRSLEAGVAYRVVIPAAEGTGQQAPLAALGLTGRDQVIDGADQTIPADDLDSDAVGVNGAAVIDVPPMAVGRGRADLDAGFRELTRVAVGSVVWDDLDGDGLREPGEPGVRNVVMELFSDADGDGQPDGPARRRTRTTAAGSYLFTWLPAGRYLVCASGLPPGYVSSTGASGSLTSGPFEGVATPGPDADPRDDDDNGTTTRAGVCSRSFVVTPGGEPLGEVKPADLTDLLDDASSNLTVDFGVFLPLALGGLVWDDRDGNGRSNPAEPALPDTEIRLLQPGPDDLPCTADDVAVATALTGTDGRYRFDGLVLGEYAVLLPASPAGTRSTVDPAEGTGADDDVIGDDSGQGDGSRACSQVVTLAPGTEPTGDGDDSANTNLTVDFGALRPRPQLELKKFTNGFEARRPTGLDGPAETTDRDRNPVVDVGAAVRWTYVITNTGNVAAEVATVVDDRIDALACGSGPAVAGGVTATTTLAAGQTLTCTAVGVANRGQYANTATVTAWGETAPGSVTELPSLQATSHYFGAAPDLVLATYALTIDGLGDSQLPGGPDRTRNHVVPEGTSVVWFYVVKNTGTVPLEDFVVTSSSGAPVDCPLTRLAPGEETRCRRNAGPAVVGQAAEIGRAEALDRTSNPTQPRQLQRSDPAHLFAARPSLTLRKTTNGVDTDTSSPPRLAVGSRVRWRYEITNTGNVAVAGISLRDDLEGAIICPADELAPGASLVCVREAVARAGEYRNTATVTGSPLTDTGTPTVTASDTSGYSGLTARLSGRTWADDGDGVRRSGEPPIADVTVTLLAGDGAVIATRTGPDGRYAFEEVPSGTYRVCFGSVERRLLAPALRGGDPAVDSDADPPSGCSAPFPIDLGDDKPDLDAGYVEHSATSTTGSTTTVPPTTGTTTSPTSLLPTTSLAPPTSPAPPTSLAPTTGPPTTRPLASPPLSTPPTSVARAPGADLAVGKRAVRTPVAAGQPVVWRIEVANRGSTAWSGSVIVVDDPGTALRVERVVGTGWQCSVTTQVWCTRTADLSAGAALDPIEITTSVVGSPATVSNRVSLQTAGDPNPANDAFLADAQVVSQLPRTGADAERFGWSLGIAALLIEAGSVLLWWGRRRSRRVGPQRG